MALTFSSEPDGSLLNIEFAGEYKFSELIEMIEPINAAAVNARSTHVLLDARSVTGRMTESEKFFVGVRIAEVFGSRLKAAIVMRPGDVTKMGEMAAVNRGANLLVTESLDEAFRWLAGPSARTTA